MTFGLEQHIIDKIISVFEANAKVDKAYVFGSRAKGNYRPDSDIDIAIKGIDITLDDILKMSVAFEDKGIKNKIDLIDYTSIKEPALQEHIVRVGIEFYSRWKEVKLQDIVSKLGDGLHGTPEYDINGEYYFINGNNLIDGRIVIKENTQRISEKEYLKYKKELSDRTILLGINGTIGNVALYNGEKCILGKSACYFNVLNTVNKDYIKYVIADKTFQTYIKNFANGSTIMNVSLKVVREYEFSLPPLPEQIAIASILSSLDDKIDLLQRQNKTLEQLAETLFRQWFVEEAEESWKVEPLGKYVTVKRGGSPRPIHNYLSDTGLRWLKISDVTGINSPFIFEIKEHIIEEGLNKTVFLKAGSIVLSNSATPGIPKILAVDTCIHDGWLYFPKSKFSNEFLYLLFLKIRLELIQQGNGSIFTNLKTDILKEYPISIPNIESLSFFDEQVKSIFKKIYENTIQIRTLTQTRDTLLPKLMSGEVRITL